MHWNGYEPFDAQIEGPLRDATREDAQRYFDRLMTARAARRAMLAKLVALDSPEKVGAWLATSLGEHGLGGDDAWIWRGVIADVALWLGERIIAAAPQLRWELLTAPKKATGYQRPVLVGFTRVDDPRYYVDVAHLVASWAELAARGRPAKHDFLATIEAVTIRDA